MDDSRNKPVKSTRGNDFRRIKVKHWGTRFIRKGAESGRRYARMSIGSASHRGPSQNLGASQQDKRRRWFLRSGNIGSRARRNNPNNGRQIYDEDLYE